jgi:hypothetical protein
MHFTQKENRMTNWKNEDGFCWTLEANSNLIAQMEPISHNEFLVTIRSRDSFGHFITIRTIALTADFDTGMMMAEAHLEDYARDMLKFLQGFHY